MFRDADALQRGVAMRTLHHVSARSNPAVWQRVDVWRHIERHEPGRILHTLYEGTAGNIGRAVPLAEHPDTTSLTDSLGEDGINITTGIRDLTAAYVPHMLPDRLHRGSDIGRSDYAAPIYDTFDALDETWTSWMRNIRPARARLAERPRVEFGDGVAESKQATATTLDLLARTRAVPTSTKVVILHSERDDTAVKAEVAAILAESGAAAPDPAGSFPL